MTVTLVIIGFYDQAHSCEMCFFPIQRYDTCNALNQHGPWQKYVQSIVHVLGTCISWSYVCFCLLPFSRSCRCPIITYHRYFLTIHHWHQSNCAFGQNLQLMWSDFVETHLLPSIPGTFPLIEVLLLSTLPPTLSTRRSRRPSKHGGMDPRSSFPSNRNTSRWGMLHVVDST